MGRLGTFMPRLVALTAVWLLATAALTYAASRRIQSVGQPAVTTHAAAPSVPKVLVVPDVRKQPYVFAEGTLGDSGFGWRVAGAVHGFAANVVVSQAPAAGTRVVDTGAPTIVLHLMRNGRQSGIAEDTSQRPGTAIRLADLASASAPAAKLPTLKPKAAARTKAPARKRPPAFVLPNVRREPLDELPLTTRANNLLHWVAAHPSPTDANVRYWLYQHAWVVTGARMGWWHGTAAVKTLLAVDAKVEAEWGIGAKSAAVAREALAFTQSHAK